MLTMNLPLKLSSSQKYVLIIAKISPSPVVAYASVSNDANTMQAAKQVYKMGFIDMDTNGIEITKDGEQQLIDNNLIDGNGNPTSDGKDVIELYAHTITTESNSLMKELISCIYWYYD